MPHILPTTFIEDVRAGKFGPDLFIEQGKKWELLMTRNRVFGRERVHRNSPSSRVYDIELRLKDMDATGVDPADPSPWCPPACTTAWTPG